MVDDELARQAHRETDAPPAPAAPAPVYEVQRRDTLWDIAERHLGDPFRWQEIFQLNQGRPQADGTCLIDPDLIYVGWKLDLPADAFGLTPAAPRRPSHRRPPPPRRRPPRTTGRPASSTGAWC